MQKPHREIQLDVIALREQWRQRGDYNCFWSGPDNDRGLRLTPTIESGRVFVDVQIEKFHSGFPGIANGGVSFTILDGMMSWYLMSQLGRGGFTKTAALTYFAPLHVGRKYRFEVTESRDEQNSSTNFRVIGKVFSIRDDKIGSRPLIEMSADFFLPDRETARSVLGVELGAEGEILFPEKERQPL